MDLKSERITMVIECRVNLARLESGQLGNLPISPMEPWAIFLFACSPLPRSATMHRIETSQRSCQMIVVMVLFCEKMSLRTVWGK